MEATRIIALRHGETAWNRDGRIQGWTDIALNERGEWQAQRAAASLAHEEFAAIYSSDLSRAHQTAQAIATGHGLTVQTHAELRERSFGAFEGQTFAQIDAQWPDKAHAWRHRVPDFTPDGGESLLTLQARITRTVHALAAGHLGQQIAVVVHGGVLDVLYRAATKVELNTPRSWSLDNAAINRLLWTPDSGLILTGWNDTLHLQDTLDEPAA